MATTVTAGTVPKPEERLPKKPPQSVGPDKPNERQIKIWKDEIRALKRNDRRSRFEMGKRLAAIQAERAKAKIGTFTTVDLKELKIPIHTAYRLINFYKRVQARIEADLLQFAKAQERWGIPLEDDDDYEQRMADAQVDALNKLLNDEDARIAKLRKARKNYARDYRLRVEFVSVHQLERFKKKWLRMEEKVRSVIVYKAVMNAKNTN